MDRELDLIFAEMEQESKAHESEAAGDAELLKNILEAYEFEQHQNQSGPMSALLNMSKLRSEK
jgi:hypothetical protein